MPYKSNIHIGKLVEEQVRKKNLSIVEFADKIHTSRTNVYHIFQSDDIPVKKLMKISEVLQYDFLDFLFEKQNSPTEIQFTISIKNKKATIRNVDFLDKNV